MAAAEVGVAAEVAGAAAVSLAEEAAVSLAEAAAVPEAVTWTPNPSSAQAVP